MILDHFRKSASVSEDVAWSCSVIQLTRKPVKGAFSIERVFFDIRRHLPLSITTRVVVNSNISKGLLPRLRDAWRARRHVADVFHVTGDVHYLTWFLPSARTALTIHDTVSMEYERGVRRLLLWIFWYWLPLHRCAKVIAISEETKRRLLRYVRCDPSKIVVIHNPVSDSFLPMPYPALKGRFRLLQIGAKRNKNFERVIQALIGLPISLVVVGRLTEAQRLLLEASGLDYENCWDLNERELRDQYAAAHALLFASTAEGFGLPIVEAQAVGRPVITSARAPMDEVAGDAALFVDPESIDCIRLACLTLMKEPELRARLVSAGFTNVARFKNDRIGAEYAAVYLQIARKWDAKLPA